MNRKWDSINFMKLYIEGDTTKWNKMLAKCLKTHDLLTLQKVYYGIQAGMDDLVKQKLNSEKISVLFLRMQKSIEDTVKLILRQKFPSPNDNPLATSAAHLEAKRKRDHELEKWFKKVRF